MTKYKVYRINANGSVMVEIVEAYDWNQLISMVQYMGDPIFRIEVCGGQEPLE